MEIIKPYFISLVFINFIISLTLYTLKYFKLESGIVEFYCVILLAFLEDPFFIFFPKDLKIL